MNYAGLPETDLERAKRSLNSITRGWFPGYAWRQPCHYHDGPHLQLLPERQMRALDEARLSALHVAFEVAGANSSPGSIRIDYVEIPDGVETLEVKRLDAAFLEENAGIIRNFFECSLTSKVGQHTSERNCTLG